MNCILYNPGFLSSGLGLALELTQLQTLFSLCNSAMLYTKAMFINQSFGIIFIPSGSTHHFILNLGNVE